jgi:hypothetical protein
MFVIYNKETTRYLNSNKKYGSKAAATRALNKAVAENNINKDDYAISEYIDFVNNIEKMVTRKNLLSGKEFQEPVNTPPYMSPACESYYSM